MKLTILVDNNVLQSKNFLGEHGLSFYIEDCGKKILFDTGYSAAYQNNAQRMGIDLLDLDYIVLSHGHYDHTGGLPSYLSLYSSAVKQGLSPKKPTIVTHPDAFLSKHRDNSGEIGCMVSEEALSKSFDLKLSKEPFKITENLTFLGEIPRENDFEGKDSIGKVRRDGELVDDYIVEDSALAYTSEEGLVIATGCSHSGICNIVKYAKVVLDEPKVYDVVGGFHLVCVEKERLSNTVGYLAKQKIPKFHPCHCTDFRAKSYLSKYLNLGATGVGLVLEYKRN